MALERTADDLVHAVRLTHQVAVDVGVGGGGGDDGPRIDQVDHLRNSIGVSCSAAGGHGGGEGITGPVRTGRGDIGRSHGVARLYRNVGEARAQVMATRR